MTGFVACRECQTVFVDTVRHSEQCPSCDHPGREQTLTTGETRLSPWCRTVEVSG